MIPFLLKVFLFWGFIEYASAIRCYDCNSANNTICLDPSKYDQETVRRFVVFAECGQGVISPQRYFCRKIVQTVFHTDRESDFRITRGCGWLRSHLDCYKADNDDHMETVCQCFEDGCNRAVSMVAPWSLIATIASIMVYVRVNDAR